MLDRAVTLGAQGSQSAAHGERGIARYLVGQAQALARLAPTAIDAFDLDPELPDPPAIDAFRSLGNVRHGEPPTASRPRLYHVMSPFEGHPRLERLWPRWAQAGDVKLAVTLYDLIPLRFPEIYLTHSFWRTWYRERLEMIRHADVVLAISEQTARDAVQLLGVSAALVHVVLGGCSDFFRPRRADDPAELAERLPEVRPGFILYTAGIEWRKNLDRLMQGYGQLPPELRRERQLVITCKVAPEARSALQRRARELGISDDFVLTGWVPDATLRELYWSCGLFVFPSLFEGFGLPIVEALRCGAPVIASDRSSMPEIVTDPRDRFDPENPADIARALQRAIADPGLRQRQLSRFRAEEFTWEQVAKKTLTAFESRLSVRPRLAAPPRRRPRLALFSPMPPQASGVADYSARLVQGLVEHCEVDVVVEGPAGRYVAPEDPRARLLPHVAFEWAQRSNPYEQILYCLGNSEFHAYMWPFMEQYPGDVLCHDVRLGGFFDCVGAQRGDPLLFARLVREHYPRLLNREERQPNRRLEPWHLARAPIYLICELQRRARRLFVHSEFARRVALADGALEVVVVPFGSPEPQPAPLFAGAPVVTSFGIVHPAKASELLVEAIGLLRQTVPDAKLVLAGEISSHYRKTLEGLAERLELRDAVVITGRLPEAEYQAHMRATTVAVQLRTVANGEMSAALADCLSAGLPTVVTELGSFAELPAEVAVRIPPDASSARLAEALAALLADRAQRERFRVGALTYSAAHRFGRVADELWRCLVATPSGVGSREADATLDSRPLRAS